MGAGQTAQAQSLWRLLLADECPSTESYCEAIVGLWNAGACNTAVQYAQRFLAEYDLERSGKQRHYCELLVAQMPMV